jgi:hypothetical protein
MVTLVPEALTVGCGVDAREEPLSPVARPSALDLLIDSLTLMPDFGLSGAAFAFFLPLPAGDGLSA